MRARSASARPGASPLAVRVLQLRATSTVVLSVFNFVVLSGAPHRHSAYKRLVLSFDLYSDCFYLSLLKVKGELGEAARAQGAAPPRSRNKESRLSQLQGFKSPFFLYK